MPNYVQSQIRWQGPQDDDVLACIFDADGRMDLNLLVPLSKAEQEDPAVRKEKWGSVYAPFQWSVEKVAEETFVMVETGWLTLLPWARKLAAQFPESEFRMDYSDEGGPCGTYLFSAGTFEHIDWEDADHSKADKALADCQPVHIQVGSWASS